jgi:EAL domain-containing protein (putative c-di-GMP-specific phosphodiesterase class I)
MKKEIMMRNKGISFDNRGDKSSFGVGRAVSKIIEGYRSDNGNSGFDLFEIDLDAIKKKQEYTSDSYLVDLLNALEKNELEIYYQPIVSLFSNKAVCFEALLRWNHPELGLVYPTQFIPYAEDIGLIKEIGSWVIRSSCRQLNNWQNEFPENKSLAVSVNVSPKQLEDQDLVNVVRSILKELNLANGSLILEITESSMIQNTREAAKIIKDLRQMGVRISLDDFGVGYSWLNGLGDFPFDSIKLDRKFVWNMLSNSKDSTIIKKILELGLKLNIEIVAEGIETAVQRDLLKGMNCKLGQGFFYSMPVRFHAVDRMLAGAVC